MFLQCQLIYFLRLVDFRRLNLSKSCNFLVELDIWLWGWLLDSDCIKVFNTNPFLDPNVTAVLNHVWLENPTLLPLLHRLFGEHFLLFRRLLSSIIVRSSLSLSSILSTLSINSPRNLGFLNILSGQFTSSHITVTVSDLWSLLRFFSWKRGKIRSLRFQFSLACEVLEWLETIFLMEVWCLLLYNAFLAFFTLTRVLQRSCIGHPSNVRVEFVYWLLILLLEISTLFLRFLGHWCRHLELILYSLCLKPYLYKDFSIKTLQL